MVHVSPSIFNFKKIAHYTQHPFKSIVGLIKEKIVTKKCVQLFCQFLFWFSFDPNFLFLELSHFRFSWYTLKTNAPEFILLLSIA